MITSKFKAEKGILFTKYVGVIKLEDLIADVDYIGNDLSLPKELRIFTDARKAKFEFKADDIPVLVEKVKDHIGKFSFVKEALIQDNPYVTALSIIYQLGLNEIHNFQYEIFSTADSCFEWLYA